MRQLNRGIEWRKEIAEDQRRLALGLKGNLYQHRNLFDDTNGRVVKFLWEMDWIIAESSVLNITEFLLIDRKVASW